MVKLDIAGDLLHGPQFFAGHVLEKIVGQRKSGKLPAKRVAQLLCAGRKFATENETSLELSSKHDLVNRFEL
jgi:hypothetical protein